MFHPNAQPMERGWVGRLDGERVVHLAAQTLQSFFLAGGRAREHAEYRLDEVTLLVPVLQPPTLRIFDGPRTFAFGNPTALRGPGAAIQAPTGDPLVLLPRLAAVIGADGAIGGYSAFADWRAPRLHPPKDRDFASALGPVVVTPDELDGAALDVVVRVGGDERVRASLDGFDWEGARNYAAARTELRPGDVLAGPAAQEVRGIGGGSNVALEVDGVGSLMATVKED
jgi:fumarylacetoacetate (FAA) hydrolase